MAITVTQIVSRLLFMKIFGGEHFAGWISVGLGPWCMENFLVKFRSRKLRRQNFGITFRELSASDKRKICPWGQLHKHAVTCVFTGINLATIEQK